MRMFYVFFILFCFQISFSQSNPGLKCGWYGKKTVEGREKVFPFSKTKNISLISFYPSQGIVEIDENNKEVKHDSIWKSNKRRSCLKVFKLIDEDEFYAKEIVQLDQKHIDELSNLMINYKINRKKLPRKTVVSVVGCYTPRNAILFLDEKDKVISYVEICFECIQFYQTPETISNFNTLCQLDECGDMIGLFKEFFRSNGIKYGIDNR